MDPEPNPESKQDRLARLLGAADAMDTIYRHVAEGGSLIDLAETWDVSFSDVTGWVRADKGREQRYVQALKDRAEWVEERVLSELRTLGLTDIAAAFGPDGKMLPVEKIPKVLRRAILSIDTSAGKIKLADKTRALEVIAKAEGFLIERHKVQEVHSLEELVSKAQQIDGESPD